MTVRIAPSRKEQLQAEFDKPYWDDLTAAPGPICRIGRRPAFTAHAEG
jgi:hypothetical protein